MITNHVNFEKFLLASITAKIGLKRTFLVREFCYSLDYRVVLYHIQENMCVKSCSSSPPQR